PLWIVRTVIELVALGIGYALGGSIGVGTVLFAFAIGPLGHWFIEWLHLGPSGTDLGPGVSAE
ncbi:MAG: YczE/YyaS/YitT family protein, partial [Acidimicrobiia bacterium]